MNSSVLLKDLNQAQTDAVTHIDGPMLVLAGPGSGKTRVITHRIAYMIEQGIDPRNILALTFTNKAAGEMRNRLDALVGQNGVWLGTFHGFCVRLLRRYARLAGLPENFSIYDVDDAESALKAAVTNAQFELTHVTLGTLANRISYFKNRLVTPEILQTEALSSQEYQVGQVYPHYQQQLLKCGAVDFDDLLMHTATLLRSHPEIRQELDERLQYVMVDEYQDTNLAQYVIMRHLCVDLPNLVATGDPDQSIYGWRGANLKNVTHLERDYPALRVVRLEENYRSTPEILSVADQLIQHNEFRKAKVLVPSRREGESVRLAIYTTARQEAEDVGNQIEALVSQGDQHYRDFGVLYRTNAHSRLIEQALLRRQIPYQLIGGFRFYLRKEIKDLVAYLLLVHNPDDDMALQRAINSPARGIGKQTLGKIQAFAQRAGLPLLEACRQVVDAGEISKRAATSVRSFLKIFDQIASLAHGPLVDLLQTTVELTKYREHLTKKDNSSDGTSDGNANLDELLAEARELDEEAGEEQSALEMFLEFAALQADTDRLTSDQDIVTLMTLHAAKGLEFPNVYVLAVEENILPHARSKDDPMALEEERRLLFVGITRAKNRLQLSYAKTRGFSGQGSGVPSSFLMELPRTEMVINDHTDHFQDFESGGDWQGGQQDWDEMCQLEQPQTAQDTSSDESYQFEADDCQLPPDEIRHRLRKGSSIGNLRFGSDFEQPAESGPFREGAKVAHDDFGEGEIVAARGVGGKRSVTIRFFADSSRRTFRLSHVKLALVQQAEFEEPEF